MDEAIKFLFTPIKVNSMELSNRIAMPSMHLNFTKNGEVTDRFIAFYRERAKGGVGLIVVGGCAVNTTAGGDMLIGIYDDRFLSGLKRLTETLHRAGDTRIAAQLYHAGRYAMSAFIGTKPVAPSPVASRLTGEVPHELTVEEITRIEDDFAEAAARAKKAGFDAVELLFSAGYLVSQFLSPLTNRRTDQYGGSLENRARFGVEVIRKVREAVGGRFPVIIRQGGSDFVKGSNDSATILEAVKLFAEAGVDMINVTGGWHETRVPQIAGAVPHAAFAYLAYGIKKVTGKPTIISNRIPTPHLAGALIRDGWGDLVNMGRPLIADPYLPQKAREGQPIRPCIACNQMCFDAVFTGKPVSCTVNPFASRELEFGSEELSKAKDRLKVVIVGGGAAGMSAAITLAERGHHVVVYEKDAVGGKLQAAAAPYDKRDFLRLKEYYTRMAERLGVEIIGREATVDAIKKEEPDRVVVATGSKPVVPPIDIESEPLFAEDVLLGRVAVGDSVVIVGGGAVGVDVALYLLERSTINGEQTKFLLKWDAEGVERIRHLAVEGFKDITIVEMLPDIGKDIGKTTRWIALKELKDAGVRMLTNTKVIAIRQGCVVVETPSGKAELQADTIILAAGYRSENALADKLKDVFGGAVYVIGDAERVGKLPDAIRAGFELGLRL